MTQPPSALPPQAPTQPAPDSRPSHPISAVFRRLGDRLELVERAMRERLGGPSELVVSIGDHVLSSGGKRMRPALVLMAAEMCGYTGPRSIQVAAAIELLHTATLLHDDVVDFSDLRRGRPSANAIWGNRRAVLGGDFLYACASNMIIEDGSVEILERFADTIGLMAEGELLQLEFSFDVGATEAQYYKVIDRKSATLLSVACESGALLGGVTRSERRSVSDFGRELGLAFQLRDDALDYDSSSSTLGKRDHTDLHEGKVTLPLLLTLKRCTGGERELIASVLKRAHQADALGVDPTDTDQVDAVPENDFAAVVDLVDRYNGAPDTVKRAGTHVAHAKASIAAFADGPAKDALLSAADYSAGRDH
jgi:octaprenyl-diphosphate synthase